MSRVAERIIAARALRSWWRWVTSRYWGWRRTTPVSRSFGLDRGASIDRYFIERFLEAHRADIRGRVLEVGDARYTRRYGRDQVTGSDVLHVVTGVDGVTLVGNLETGDGIPIETFDCAIITQTLQHIYDVRAAVERAHAALTPGGILLATVPGISQISRYDMDRWGDYWRFTTLSIRRLFTGVFARGEVSVRAFGNVLTAVAFLQGRAAEELHLRELECQDPDYEVLITVRAVKCHPNVVSAVRG